MCEKPKVEELKRTKGVIFTIYNQLRYVIFYNYNGELSDNILIIHVKYLFPLKNFCNN